VGNPRLLWSGRQEAFISGNHEILEKSARADAPLRSRENPSKEMEEFSGQDIESTRSRITQ